jgi:hypothetical protein
MKNNTEVQVIITMDNVDHADALIKALNSFFSISDAGGDSYLIHSDDWGEGSYASPNTDISNCGLIGHDVRKPKSIRLMPVDEPIEMQVGKVEIEYQSYYVWRKQGGMFITPHSSLESAKAEAERLAIKHNDEVLVLAVLGAVAPVTPQVAFKSLEKVYPSLKPMSSLYQEEWSANEE